MNAVCKCLADVHDAVDRCDKADPMSHMSCGVEIVHGAELI